MLSGSWTHDLTVHYIIMGFGSSLAFKILLVFFYFLFFIFLFFLAGKKFKKCIQEQKGHAI